MSVLAHPVEHLIVAAVGSILPIGCVADTESLATNMEGAASISGASAMTKAGSAPSVQWIGAVENTDVRVAMIAGKDKARLYFCGGSASYASSTRWFEIPFDGGEHVDFEDGEWHIHAHLQLASLNGEVELGDHVTRTMQAVRARPGTLSGLYEGVADCGRVGLIVTQASKDAPASAQGACTDTSDASSQPIEAIAPVTAEAGGIRVRTSENSDASLLLHPATLDPS